MGVCEQTAGCKWRHFRYRSSVAVVQNAIVHGPVHSRVPVTKLFDGELATLQDEQPCSLQQTDDMASAEQDADNSMQPDRVWMILASSQSMLEPPHGNISNPQGEICRQFQVVCASQSEHDRRFGDGPGRRMRCDVLPDTFTCWSRDRGPSGSTA